VRAGNTVLSIAQRPEGPTQTVPHLWRSDT
jgi:hypothetical protein